MGIPLLHALRVRAATLRSRRGHQRHLRRGGGSGGGGVGSSTSTERPAGLTERPRACGEWRARTKPSSSSTPSSISSLTRVRIRQGVRQLELRVSQLRLPGAGPR